MSNYFFDEEPNLCISQSQPDEFLDNAGETVHEYDDFYAFPDMISQTQPINSAEDELMGGNITEIDKSPNKDPLVTHDASKVDEFDAPNLAISQYLEEEIGQAGQADAIDYAEEDLLVAAEKDPLVAHDANDVDDCEAPNLAISQYPEDAEADQADHSAVETKPTRRFKTFALAMVPLNDVATDVAHDSTSTIAIGTTKKFKRKFINSNRDGADSSPGNSSKEPSPDKRSSVVRTVDFNSSSRDHAFDVPHSEVFQTEDTFISHIDEKVRDNSSNQELLQPSSSLSVAAGSFDRPHKIDTSSRPRLTGGFVTTVPDANSMGSTIIVGGRNNMSAEEGKKEMEGQGSNIKSVFDLSSSDDDKEQEVDFGCIETDAHYDDNGVNEVIIGGLGDSLRKPAVDWLHRSPDAAGVKMCGATAVEAIHILDSDGTEDDAAGDEGNEGIWYDPLHGSKAEAGKTSTSRENLKKKAVPSSSRELQTSKSAPKARDDVVSDTVASGSDNDTFNVPVSLSFREVRSLKFSELWNVLEASGWTWKRGRGLVSYIYSRPAGGPGNGVSVASTSSKRDLQRGIDFFESEEAVMKFVLKVTEKRAGNGTKETGHCPVPLLQKPREKVTPPSTTISASKSRLLSSAQGSSRSRLKKNNDSAGKAGNDDVGGLEFLRGKATDDDDEVWTESGSPVKSDPNNNAAGRSARLSSSWIRDVMDSQVVTFSAMWEKLQEEGWHWVYGRSGLVDIWYIKPGFDMRTSVVGESRFGTELDVRKYISRTLGMGAGASSTRSDDHGSGESRKRGKIRAKDHDDDRGTRDDVNDWAAESEDKKAGPDSAKGMSQPWGEAWVNKLQCGYDWNLAANKRKRQNVQRPSRYGYEHDGDFSENEIAGPEEHGTEEGSASDIAGSGVKGGRMIRGKISVNKISKPSPTSSMSSDSTIKRKPRNSSMSSTTSSLERARGQPLDKTSRSSASKNISEQKQVRRRRDLDASNREEEEEEERKMDHRHYDDRDLHYEGSELVHDNYYNHNFYDDDSVAATDFEQRRSRGRNSIPLGDAMTQDIERELLQRRQASRRSISGIHNHADSRIQQLKNRSHDTTTGPSSSSAHELSSVNPPSRGREQGRFVGIAHSSATRARGIAGAKSVFEMTTAATSGNSRGIFDSLHGSRYIHDDTIFGSATRGTHRPSPSTSPHHHQHHQENRRGGEGGGSEKFLPRVPRGRGAPSTLVGLAAVSSNPRHTHTRADDAAHLRIAASSTSLGVRRHSRGSLVKASSSLFGNLTFAFTGISDAIRNSLTKSIYAHGGNVVKDLDEVEDEKNENNGSVILISQPDAYRRMTFFSALVKGCAILHFLWVEESVELGQLQDAKKFSLPAGYSGMHPYFILPSYEFSDLRSAGPEEGGSNPIIEPILSGVRLLNLAGKHWDKILRALGCSLVARSQPALNALLHLHGYYCDGGGDGRDVNDLSLSSSSSRLYVRGSSNSSAAASVASSLSSSRKSSSHSVIMCVDYILIDSPVYAEAAAHRFMDVNCDKDQGKGRATSTTSSTFPIERQLQTLPESRLSSTSGWKAYGNLSELEIRAVDFFARFVDIDESEHRSTTSKFHGTPFNRRMRIGDNEEGRDENSGAIPCVVTIEWVVHCLQTRSFCDPRVSDLFRLSPSSDPIERPAVRKVPENDIADNKSSGATFSRYCNYDFVYFKESKFGPTLIGKIMELHRQEEEEDDDEGIDRISASSKTPARVPTRAMIMARIMPLHCGGRDNKAIEPATLLYQAELAKMEDEGASFDYDDDEDIDDRLLSHAVSLGLTARHSDSMGLLETGFDYARLQHLKRKKNESFHSFVDDSEGAEWFLVPEESLVKRVTVLRDTEYQALKYSLPDPDVYVMSSSWERMHSRFLRAQQQQQRRQGNNWVDDDSRRSNYHQFHERKRSQDY